MFTLRSNMSSKAQSGTTVYVQNTRRKYIFIVAAGGAVTCAVAGGDPFTIPDGGHWAPHITPTSELTLVGPCVVTTDTAHP
jgi:hypothetical protein